MIFSSAIVEIHNPGWHPFWRHCRVWVPLFLLWIPLILLAPLILFILFLVCVVGGIDFFQAGTTLWGVLSSLPGTQVHVAAKGSQVFVRVQ